MARRTRRAKRGTRRVVMVAVVLGTVSAAAVAAGVVLTRRRRVPQLQPVTPTPTTTQPRLPAPAPAPSAPGDVLIFDRTFNKSIMGYAVQMRLAIRERGGSFVGQYQASGAGQRVSGSMPLSGNTKQTVNKNGVSVTYTVSDWALSPGSLAFRLKVSAAKGIFSFDVLDERISATRPGSITAGLAR